MIKIIKIIAWTFGLASTLIMTIIGIGYFIQYLGDPEQLSDKDLYFNKERYNTALETIKLLLPMTSGYVLAVAPIVKYLKDEKLLWSKEIIFGIILTFAFGILSIGLWSGVLAFLVDAAHGFDENIKNYQQLNFIWNQVGVFSSLAHLSFFTSVSWFITTSILTLIESWKLKEIKN